MSNTKLGGGDANLGMSCTVLGTSKENDLEVIVREDFWFLLEIKNYQYLYRHNVPITTNDSSLFPW